MNRFRTFIAAIRPHADAENIFIGTGTVCLTIGVWQIYSPAAFVVVGLILFWLGLGLPGLGSPPAQTRHRRGN